MEVGVWWVGTKLVTCATLYIATYWQDVLDPVFPETLLHKAIGMSEKGAMLDSCRHSEGGETSEAYLFLKRERAESCLVPDYSCKQMRGSSWSVCTCRCEWNHAQGHSQLSWLTGLFQSASS